MLRVIARTFLVLVLLLSLTAVPALAAGGAVGTQAADFDLLVYDGGGATMSLSGQSGKVVLMFVVGYG